LADTEFLGLSPLLSGHSADSVPTPCDSDLGPETKNCRKHNRRLWRPRCRNATWNHTANPDRCSVNRNVVGAFAWI